MQTVQIDPNYEDVVSWLRPKVVPWRKFTIAIDGVDNAGKSSLARFLAWQLGMPAIETDLVANSDCTVPKTDGAILLQLIDSRHACNCPVIVEGVFILRSLDAIAITPDVLIRVCATGRDGSHTWEQEFSDYESKFPRSNQPDYEVLWQPSE